MTEPDGPDTEVERRRADAARNRGAILAAAARLMAPDSGLNMREVAVTAGVSRSTLYRPFPTRSSLKPPCATGESRRRTRRPSAPRPSGRRRSRRCGA